MIAELSTSVAVFLKFEIGSVDNYGNIVRNAICGGLVSYARQMVSMRQLSISSSITSTIDCVVWSSPFWCES